MAPFRMPSTSKPLCDLSDQEEAAAKERADISIMAMHTAIASLILLAAFSFFMVFSERSAGG